MKWGTDSGGSGAASEQAALVRAMISEVPHFSQETCGCDGSGQHHFVSIISFLAEPDSIEAGRRFDGKWGGITTKVGRSFDSSGAPFRTKWGTRISGRPVADKIRAFPSTFPAHKGLLTVGSRFRASAFRFAPPCAVHDPSSWRESEAG